MTNVFFVEDEYMVREHVKRSKIWTRGTFQLVGEASNGEDALEKMANVSVDILLTDIKMPFMDGIALSAAVKERWPHIQIIILSGYDDFTYAQKALKIGVTEYLMKPVKADSLYASLQEVAEAVERERTARDRIQSLYSMVESCQQAREQKFFNDISTGLLTRKDIHAEAGAMGLQLQAPWYLAGIVDFSLSGNDRTDVDQPLDTLRVMEQLHAVLRRGKRTQSFSRGNNDVCFFLLGDSAQDLLDRSGELGEAILLESQALDCISACTVCFGRPVEDVTDLCESFANASFVLQMRPLLGDRSLLYAEEFAASITEQTLSLNAEKQLISNLLYLGQKEDIPLVCKKVEQKLRQLNLSNLLFLHFGFEMILILQEFCQNIQADIREMPLQEPLADFSCSARQGDLMHFVEMSRKLFSVAIEFRNNHRGSRHGHLISASKSYVREHFGNPDLSLQEVASQIGISHTYFSSLFRQETGQTFVEFLTCVRMEAAKRLLADPGKRTTEIAFDVGYSDPNYFSKLFKKLEGCSPREYRASLSA